MSKNKKLTKEERVLRSEKIYVFCLVWIFIDALIGLSIMVTNIWDNGLLVLLGLCIIIFGGIVPLVKSYNNYQNTLYEKEVVDENYSQEFLDAYDNLVFENYEIIKLFKRKFIQDTILMYIAVFSIFPVLAIVGYYFESEIIGYLVVLIYIFCSNRNLGIFGKREESKFEYLRLYKEEVLKAILKIIDKNIEFNVVPKFETEFSDKYKKLSEYGSHQVEDEVIMTLIDGTKIVGYDYGTYPLEGSADEIVTRSEFKFRINIDKDVYLKLDRYDEPSGNKKIFLNNDEILVKNDVGEGIVIDTQHSDLIKKLLKNGATKKIYDLVVYKKYKINISIQDAIVKIEVRKDDLYDPNKKDEKILDKKTLYAHYFIIKYIYEIANQIKLNSNELEKSEEVE